jgi:hypothetical protein
VLPSLVERGNLESFLLFFSRGNQSARIDDNDARIGSRKKRMLFCNGIDIGFNVTKHESELTSDWFSIARKFEELTT